ncbi:MAG: hypothetical protein EZS28_019988 [Streblomastix strix]|uniref:Uncharacterized protein n=1 Tax=Streblomastix strix TaxID=222440 RepID=A0A5J4VPC1_9EUKA|nr:MAG: hypothetical protein EZS28_019988 [Streblomastix strix]
MSSVAGGCIPECDNEMNGRKSFDNSYPVVKPQHKIRKLLDEQIEEEGFIEELETHLIDRFDISVVRVSIQLKNVLLQMQNSKDQYNYQIQNDSDDDEEDGEDDSEEEDDDDDDDEEQ